MQITTQKSKTTKSKKKSNSTSKKIKFLPQNLISRLEIPNDKLNELIGLLNSSLFDECVKLARQLSVLSPTNGFVWKILGTAYQRQNSNELAIEALQKALQYLPRDFEISYNIANALFDLKRFDEAINFYKKSISIKPEFFEAYFNLGSVYECNNLFDLAELTYKKVLEINPKQSNAYFFLADLYKATQTSFKAQEEFKQVLDIHLLSTEASLALAIEFDKIGRTDESELCFKHAISLKPENTSELYIAYSNYFNKEGNLIKAIDFLNKTIEIEPENFNANSHLGLIYLEQKDYKQAGIYLKKALEINDNDSNAYVNFGLFLYRKGELYESEKYLMKALDISPENYLAFNNLGLVYDALFNHAKAVDTFKKALAIHPSYLPSLINIALSLNRLGNLTMALQYARQGLSQDPLNKSLNINTAVIYQGIGQIKRAIDANLTVISQDHQNILAYNNLFYSLCLSQDYTAEYFLNKLMQFGAVVTDMASFQFNEWHRNNSKKIKIGFVSADFFDHPVGSFLLNVVRNISKNCFQISAYTNNAHEDDITVELKSHFDDWISIVGLTDSDAANIIHRDGIDLLIDLSGHTSGNRLSMFAYRPAPVQMTWLGYWDSTGIEQIDYILLDEMSAPQNMQKQYTESIQYIPDTRFCYSSPRIDVPVNDLPAKHNSYITFGAYHSYAKVSDEVIELWASILKDLPTSRLHWQTKAFCDQCLIEQTHQKFKGIGIDPKRIDLIGFMTRQAYLESYHKVDFILDCFPFSACTTTCDGLWMGVPTLTIPDKRVGGRQGASLMNAVGMPNWIASDKNEFVSKAIKFANNVDELALIRSQLRQQLLQSTLGDGKKFTKNLENVFIDILKKHQIANIELDYSEQQAYDRPIDQLEIAINEVYQIALQAQEKGNYEEAVKGYLEILKVNNKHAEANHNLGFIETHMRGVDIALPRFEAAVKAKPDSEQFWVSYIDALIMSSAFDTAKQAIEHGLKYALSEETARLLSLELNPHLEAKRIAPNLDFNPNPLYLNIEEFVRPDIKNPIKFLIVAPVYNHKSAGICLLHKLCDALNKQGHFVALILTSSNNFQYTNNPIYFGPRYIKYQLKDIYEYESFVKSGVVIYPEIISGNPLNAQHVVRYMLNKEGKVSGNKTLASEQDFILAFSKEFHAQPNAILTGIVQNLEFNDFDSKPTDQRNLNLTYIGKGSTHQECFVIPNSVEINRQYPTNQSQLAMLLKNTRYFFSWDTVSQINIDALFCGAIPVFMNAKPHKNFDELHNTELGKFPMATCNFVNGDHHILIPEDYQETAMSFKARYLKIANAFEDNLSSVVNAITKHFNLNSNK